MSKKTKVVQTSGKKKTAVARVTIKEGKGRFKVNGTSIDAVKPKFSREVIQEPVALAQQTLGENFRDKLDISATVNGGGIMGQAFATRTAIGKALTNWTQNEELKKLFLSYDRSILINDTRVKEAKKFLKKGARAKPTKSYR